MRQAKPTGMSEPISRLRKLEGWNSKYVRADREPAGIDTEQEYLTVLFNLGLLDDDDDWSMYLQQEDRYGIEWMDYDPLPEERWQAVTRFYEVMSQKLMSKKVITLGPERPRPAHIPYVYELRVKSDR